jgi:hypothetical protein
MRAVVRVTTAMATTVAALLVFGVAGAIPALAQTGGYNPPVEVSPAVITGGGAGASPAGRPLAFTGAELTLLFVALAVLVTLGALALIAARRRAARAT